VKTTLFASTIDPSIKTSLFISVHILRDLISLSRRSLGSYAVGGEIPLCFFLRSHVPMERFFDGMDQENSKDQERKNGGKKKKRLLPTTKSPLHTYI
jgi:hypothetical protein